MKRGRPPKYTLDWRQADEVRRRRREGQSWSEIARWLGWRLPDYRQAHRAVRDALRRAPAPPGDGLHGASGLPREAADVKWLVYTCAKCGGTFQLDVSRDEHGVQTKSAHPVRKRARLGGHWWCEECARRRYRIDRTAAREVPPAFWGAQ